MNFYNASSISSDTTIKLHKGLTTWNLWQWVMNFVQLDAILDKVCGSLDLCPAPQLCYKRARNGEFYFEIYHPTTNQCLTFDSEKDIREWFERQASQSTEPDYFKDLMRR